MLNVVFGKDQTMMNEYTLKSHHVKYHYPLYLFVFLGEIGKLKYSPKSFLNVKHGAAIFI